MAPSFDTSGDEPGLTLTVLGCGTMGIAILSGVLAALADSNTKTPSRTPLSQSGTATPVEEVPPLLPTRFIACVTRPESAKKVKQSLSEFPTNVNVLVNNNLQGAQLADVVLLGCKPQMFREILGAHGMRAALRGKLLISILAGVTSTQIEEVLSTPSDGDTQIQDDACRVIRVMPNTAASVRESMTVIANPTPPLDHAQSALVTWIFNKIGRVVRLPPSALDASTALCGSGPAFMALVLEALADGGVAMGIPRAEAQMMAAQTMRGATGMVLNGVHPAILRDKVSTPGGCTIGGLLVLEEGTVRGTMARAVREATVVASQLGQGVTGVNGTRFR